MKSRFSLTRPVLFSMAAIASTASFLVEAQDLTQYPVLTGQPYFVPSQGVADLSARGISGRLYGSLDILGTYSSNFYYTTDSDPNKVHAWGESLQPVLIYENNLPRLDFKLGGIGQFARFDTPHSLDNYGDGTLFTTAIWHPLRQMEVGGRASYQYGHDPFGTNRTEASPTSNVGIDRWQQQNYAISAVVGSSSHLSLETSLSYLDRHYTANRESTAFLLGTKYQDYSILYGEATGLYLISPKTSILLDFVGSSIDTPHVAPGFADNGGTLYQLRTGVRWLATAKVSGDVRVGYERRQFNASGARPFDRPDWQATVSWRAKAYRRFSLETAQRSAENYQINNQAEFINDRYVALSWSEDWSPRFNSSLVGNYINAKFVNAVPRRTDNNYVAVLYTSYAVTRTISIIANGSFGRRNSDIGFSDYSRGDVYFGLRLTPFGGRLANLVAPESPVRIAPEE